MPVLRDRSSGSRGGRTSSQPEAETDSLLSSQKGHGFDLEKGFASTDDADRTDRTSNSRTLDTQRRKHMKRTGSMV